MLMVHMVSQIVSIHLDFKETELQLQDKVGHNFWMMSLSKFLVSFWRNGGAGLAKNTLSF